MLWLGALAGGISSGAIDLGINAAVSAETPMATRAAAMAGWNAITGPRGMVAAFLMSVLVQLRLVDVTGALLLCAATALVGVVFYVRSGVGEAGAATTMRRDAATAGAAPAGA